MEFERRLKEFRAQEVEKDLWIQGVIREHGDLLQRYKTSCNDLRSEKDARRSAQEREEELQRKYDGLQSSMDHSSFILVLIDADADGYMFEEKYLSQAAEGGFKAAQDLKAALRKYLITVSANFVAMPIMLRAYASLDGLSTALKRAGMIAEAGNLPLFARGFSQADALFDFVFVGSGKESADHKIKGVFDRFIQSPTCKHIVFGACHDNGYVRNLEGYVQDPNVFDRLTLLKSFETGREFLSLNYRTAQLESVFRRSPLPRHLALPPSKALVTIPSTGSAIHEQLGIVGGLSTTTSDKEGSFSAKSPPPQHMKGSSTHSNETIYLNSKGERVDKPLDLMDTAAEKRFLQRINGNSERFCHMFQLNGSCKERNCKYQHNLLPKGEILVLRTKLRGQVCKVGLTCRDRACIYGHNCQCSRPKCNFKPAHHNVDDKDIQAI